MIKKLIILVLLIIGGIIYWVNIIESKNFDLNLFEINSNLEKISENETSVINKEIERETLKKFRIFYSDFSTDTINKYTKDLYNEDIYFIDPLHQINGIDKVIKYFIKTAEPIKFCRFEIQSIDNSNNHYYVRWNMFLISKVTPNKKIIAPGFTHFIMNQEGKIIFHQDFWDMSLLYDKLPVIGFWSKLVKGRILGNEISN